MSQGKNYRGLQQTPLGGGGLNALVVDVFNVAEESCQWQISQEPGRIVRWRKSQQEEVCLQVGIRVLDNWVC